MANTGARRRKTFPELDAVAVDIPHDIQAVTTDSDDSGNDSEQPEAVTLAGGKAAADARDSARRNHQKRLREKKKAANKAREAFIQSTKSNSQTTSRSVRKSQVPGENESEGESRSGGGEESEPEENGGDPVLLARMQRAMEDAQHEAEEGSDEEAEEPQSDPTASSTRLPDSIFAAAAAEQQKPERKRKKAKRTPDTKSKRQRVRGWPSERIVGGRTIRIATAPDAPPPPPARVYRKMTTATKGGMAFRRNWKRRDATQAQIRSRSGPAQKFATSS
ncbi:hypothetical protein RhiJN_06819 [Ceratobasidium sp. AG-Ba]|nr:hypothetical protein RhiJN_06819 [Ceratobasidium sp. AG-Ba]QRW07734.1 hypothetical protein RhiLY_06733 [Ceratobasidium sp. AG-Ba]